MTQSEKNRIFHAAVQLDKIIDELPLTVKQAVALVNGYNEFKNAVEAVQVVADPPPKAPELVQ